jgi:hypothetical protein
VEDIVAADTDHDTFSATAGIALPDQRAMARAVARANFNSRAVTADATAVEDAPGDRRRRSRRC